MTSKKQQIVVGNNGWVSKFIFSCFILSISVMFYHINRVQPTYYIDEMFHIPQTMKYCNGKFFEWDPKITTLPGTYLITTIMLAPFGLCDIFYIRCTNVLATLLNFYLISSIVKLSYKNAKGDATLSKALQLGTAYNVTLLPPLFFWCFLYYTDVVSVSAVLLTWKFYLSGNIYLSAMSGCLATLIRQTNIVWVAYVAFEKLLDVIESKGKRPARSAKTKVTSLWAIIDDERKKGLLAFTSFLLDILKNVYPYVLIGLSFLAFLIWNGGIVVGDREAHKPVLHIPQIFYFSSFTLLFAWPYMLPKCKDFLSFIKRHFYFTIVFTVLVAVIIHFNTLVHPYLLADNRHYTFYAWNKFFNRYTLFKYLLIPVYGFSMYSLISCLSHLRLTSKVGFFAFTFITLVPQLLLEPRYFFNPYIIFRLSLPRPRLWQMICEFITALVINIFQFYIFSTKTFYWKDFTEPQRISW